MADEPSIPMDQEEEDNDEYFSARESPGRRSGSQENLRSSTPTPQKSDRNGRDSSPLSGKQQFFSDEAAQQGSENSSTKKSERRRLKDKNRWDMREYKKEELEAPAKPKKKKKKSKNKKKEEEKKPEEKSKTDEESEEKDEPQSPLPASPSGQPRPFFQSQKLILQTRAEKAIAPKCKFYVLRFSKAQEVVEYDAEGQQHLLDHYNERAISNPWRRWGAHRALCDQGGYLVDKNKKLVEIKRGSDPPKCPPNPRQVTLNKNCEAPDSQTMMGTLRVEVGPADEEVHRIARVMEDYVVKNGGFVPPPMTRKEMQTRPAKGQPVVVVQTKGGQSKEVSGIRKQKKNSKPKQPKKKTQSQSQSSSGSQSGEGDSDESCEEGDSTAEKGNKKNLPVQPPSNPPPQPVPMENSKKGGFGGFLKRKKAQIQGKAKARNNKGSQR